MRETDAYCQTPSSYRVVLDINNPEYNMLNVPSKYENIENIRKKIQNLCKKFVLDKYLVVKEYIFNIIFRF